MKSLMFSLMDWAAAQRIAPGPMAVLKELCRRADLLGTCYPSQRRIAADTGMGERTVRRHIAFLEEQGLIERTRRQRGYIRRSDSYRIMAPEVVALYEERAAEKAARKAANPVRKAYATVIYGAKKLAGAEAAKLAGTNNEAPYEHKNNNYVFILGKKVFNGAEDNPLWSTFGPITLRRAAYKALQEIFRLSGDQLDDVIMSAGAWMNDHQDAGVRANWMGVLVGRLQKITGIRAAAFSPVRA